MKIHDIDVLAFAKKSERDIDLALDSATATESVYLNLERHRIALASASL